MRWDDSATGKVGRLSQAMRTSWEDMQPFRESAGHIIEEYAGDLYGNRGNAKRVYVNKIQQMTNIYSRLISSGTPRVRVSSPDYPERRPFAEAFTVNLNRRLEEQRLGEVSREAFINAMLGVGIVKTGLAEGDEEYEIDGQWYDPGLPFSEVISLDNFIIDMQAESLNKIEFIGDRFLMDREWVNETFKFGKDDDGGQASRMDGDHLPEGRVSGTEDRDPEGRLYDSVWVWEVFLPKENKMCLFPAGREMDYIEKDWDGPEGGPYEVLDLIPVPNEVLPTSPAGIIFHLHAMINRSVRKLSNQTGRQKQVTAFSGGSEDDAERVQKADDGDIVKVNDPDSLKVHQFGGPDPQVHNMAIWGSQVADLLAGNLSALGGLAPQSETFKQDAMLQEQASAIIETFRDKTNQFLERIIYKHAWFLWTDEVRPGRVVETRKFNGIEVPIAFDFSAEEREGDFLEYNFDLDVYSMRKESPAEKAQKLTAMLQNVLMPGAEMLMQGGFAPNMVGIIQQLADLYDIPFDILLQSMDPQTELPQRPGEVQPPASMAPQNSTRTYERVSRPGTTPAGNDKNLMQANLGAKPQNGEAASLSRDM